MLKRSRINQLARVTLSLCLVAFICIALFYVYDIYNQREKQYEAKLGRYATTLEQLSVRLDGDFRDLWQIVSIVEKQERLRPVYIEEGNVTNQINGVSELKNMLLSNQNLADIGIYYIDPKFMLTTAGVYSDVAIESTYYRYTGLTNLLDILEWNNANSTSIPLIHGLDTIYRVKLRDSRQVMTLFYPIPYWSQTPYATLMLQVDAQRLVSELSLGDLEGYTVIVDKAGQLIASSEKLPQTLIDIIPNFEFVRDAQPQKLVLSQQDYYVLNQQSEVLGFDYAVFIPAWVLDTVIPADEQPVFYMLIIVGLLVICVLLIRWSYSPMQVLLAASTNQSNGRIKRFMLNEQDCILNQLQNLDRENRALHSQISQSLSTLRESLIIRLVSQHYDDLDQVMELCRRSGISLNHNCYAIALICFKDSVRTQRACAFVSDQIELHIVCDMREDTLLALICSECASRDLAVSKLQMFVDEYSAEYPNRATVVVGNWVPDLGDLNCSYRSASQTMERVLYLGINGVQFADDFDVPKEVGYPVDMLYNLKYSLLRRDREQGELCMQQLLNYLVAEDTTPYVAQLTARDVVLLLSRRSENANSASCVDLDVSSAQRLVEQLKLCWHQYIQNDQAVDVDKNLLIEKVLLYIEEHLERVDFSIRTISSNFGMTESAFSHMFKRNMKQNFISYINELKIQRAQQMLADTDITIEEIATKLNYSTSSNFSRMFKAVVNFTPSQYRQATRMSLYGGLDNRTSLGNDVPQENQTQA